MSDLISRAELIKQLRDAENNAFNGFYRGIVKAHKIVTNMPTVDAIPIEWILKWKENFKNNYGDEYDPTVAEMLVDMLEDWECEHE